VSPLPACSYWVVTDRWQRFSDLALSEASVVQLAGSCDEFLVHGVDVEVRQFLGSPSYTADQHVVGHVEVQLFIALPTVQIVKSDYYLCIWD
jgi:hypothetical protein